MKKDISTEYQLSELILLVLEGGSTPEQRRRLTQWLREDPEAMEYYVEYMMQYSALTQPGDIAIVDLPEETVSPVLETSLWMALSAFEQQAEAVEVARPAPVLPEPERKAAASVPTAVSKFSLYALLLSTAALVFLIAYAFLSPAGRGKEVATLLETMNARWGSPERGIREGMWLNTQMEPIWLREGIAVLQFDNGSRVVLEGPAEFTLLTDDQIQLRHGRLFASVPKTAIGFTVSTPFSKIIDLGTEFGVKTEPERMEVHVMAGRTMLISGTARTSKTQLEVREGFAKAVSAAGVVQDIALKKEAFVRRLQPQTQFVWRGQNVNLADIVGGGNGFGTGRLNAGIDYQGTIDLLETFTSAEGPKQYVPVRSSLFIDGVFIPNGRSQINSNGLTFEFEPTNGRYWLGVLNGAWHQIALTVKVPRHQLRLNGKEYGTPDSPAIYLSSNQGVTFNLQAIREYTKMNIRRFTALCGLSETYRDYWEIMKQYPHFPQEPTASFYVLVDGKVRFVQQDMTPGEPARQVVVDIGPEDRFLTLATTQGRDKTNNGDWTLFAEPFLELQE
ncbi:MAG TPA: FecR domain-containing protein [Anaerohalosphaeraceae bacterium]|nr:FecR domain-containing protein [Anaerohalosphaeraceae bacterium]